MKTTEIFFQYILSKHGGHVPTILEEKAVMQILQKLNRLEHCAVNCVDTVDICTQVYVSIHSGMQWHLGQQTFKWTLRRGLGGGGV